MKPKNKIRRTHYVNLNKLVWKYFKDCQQSGIQLNGKHLKDQAMRYASILGLETFRGSEGWLDAFKRRHQIDLRTMTGQPVCYENEYDEDGELIETTNIITDPTPTTSSGVPDLNSMLEFAQSTVNGTLFNFFDQSGNDQMKIDENPAGSIPTSSEQSSTADLAIKKPDEILNLAKSCALRVRNKEVTFALDTIRSFIINHDPSALGSLVELQEKLVKMDR